MSAGLDNLKHIVVLMMENRSFDHMLGGLKQRDGRINGLTGNESNPDDTGRQIKVFKIDHTAKHPYLMPGADPGEGFHNTNAQLFSTDDASEDADHPIYVAAGP